MIILDEKMRRTVVKVIDGDTFIINRKVDGTNKVRLANVDMPEIYQYGGRQSTSALKRLIGGRQVTLVPVGRSYDRIVANVRVRRKSVNKLMNSLF